VSITLLLFFLCEAKSRMITVSVPSLAAGAESWPFFHALFSFRPCTSPLLIFEEFLTNKGCHQFFLRRYRGFNFLPPFPLAFRPFPGFPEMGGNVHSSHLAVHLVAAHRTADIVLSFFQIPRAGIPLNQPDLACFKTFVQFRTRFTKEFE